MMRILSTCPSTLPLRIGRKSRVFQAIIASVVLLILFASFQSIYRSATNTVSLFISIYFDQSSSNGPDQLHCFHDVHRAFQALNASWFVTFGSALFYHRNRSFNTHDIDTGMFIHDLMPISDRLMASFEAHGFRLESSFGRLDDGQEWAFRCPSSRIRVDIFIFYPPLPSDPKISSFVWWTSMHGGDECDRKRYQKCRLRFSSIQLEQVIINSTTFRFVPTKFIVEHYGQSWTEPIHYDYYHSMKFLYNIIDE